MPPKAFSIPTIATLLALSGASLTQAQSVYSEIQGALPTTLKAQSDTVVSVPFATEAAYSGAVDSVGINGNAVTITPSGTPGWTASAYATLYYVRFTSGAKAGMYYQVTANDTGTLTVDSAGDDLSGVLATDSFKVFKFWTLATLFPDSDLNGVIASPLPGSRQTEILVPSTTGMTTYYFLNNGTVAEWRKVGSTTTQDNLILWPDSYFVVRQVGKTPITSDTLITTAGIVETSEIDIVVDRKTTGTVDNYVSHGRPVGVTLNNLGLISSGAFSPSAKPGTRIDELYVFDNAASGINKAASATYYYLDNGTVAQWRKVGSTADMGATIIQPGTGMIIRKGVATSNSSVFWSVSAL